MTSDGNCMHVILAGFDYETEHGVNTNVVQKIRQERKRPQGLQPLGLFAVEGQDKKLYFPIWTRSISTLKSTSQTSEQKTTTPGVTPSKQPPAHGI